MIGGVLKEVLRRMHRPPKGRLLLFMVMLMLPLLFFYGCSEEIEEKAAEHVLSKIIKEQTGEKTKVKVKSGKIEISDEKGRYSFAARLEKEKRVLPQPFPAGIPFYPQAVLSRQETEAKPSLVVLLSEDAPDQVIGFYRTYLKAAGWQEDAY